MRILEREEGGGLVGAQREQVDSQREARRVVAVEREREARRRERRAVAAAARERQGVVVQRARVAPADVALRGGVRVVGAQRALLDEARRHVPAPGTGLEAWEEALDEAAVSLSMAFGARVGSAAGLRDWLGPRRRWKRRHESAEEGAQATAHRPLTGHSGTKT